MEAAHLAADAGFALCGANDEAMSACAAWAIALNGGAVCEACAAAFETSARMVVFGASREFAVMKTMAGLSEIRARGAEINALWRRYELSQWLLEAAQCAKQGVELITDQGCGRFKVSLETF